TVTRAGIEDARTFELQDGAAVTVMGRCKDALEDSRKALLADVPKGVVEIYAGDAQSAEDVQAALKIAYGIQKRLDIIVSTVGAAAFRPILMHTAETFREALDINIITAFLAVRYGAPLMDHGGSIVCVSSTAAKLTFAWLAAYHTAKGGLENFVKAAAEELGPAGIRVNSVRPGLVRNAPDKPLFTNPALLTPWVEQTPLRQRVPGQLCENEDVGAAVRFLAGPEASWVTGQSFAVDGGLELRKNPDMTSSATHLFGEAAMRAILKGKSPT
ncbi:MAG: SDR family oxidoreductase, partial [Rhodospirillaceae bacterium]|nr:SDR family oxidoreductase [Rhodospirillaceae bacterium]